MYIDSSQTVGNDSMQVVAKLLRDTLEPIIKVSCGLNCGHVTESTFYFWAKHCYIDLSLPICVAVYIDNDNIVCGSLFSYQFFIETQG